MPLPNIKKIFIPDPGWVLVEADLEGADAMTAAWEIGGNFKADFVSGNMKHTETMKLCYPEAYALAPKHEPQYTKCKNMLYGSIYVGSARGIASQASIPEPIVRKFQPWFFGRYPEVKDWHRRVDFELQTTREVSNAFGYRVHYFDRIDGLLPEAVNWKCQSTTSIVCQRGKLILHEEFDHASVQVLLDVHDSLVFQVRERSLGILRDIREKLNAIRVPYSEPLYIPWAFKSSCHSWGDTTPVRWESVAAA